MNNRGFTLVELLTVISIISFIANIAVANAFSAQVSARDTVRGANLELLRDVLELYYNDNGHYPMIASVPQIGYDCTLNMNACKRNICNNPPSSYEFIPDVLGIYISNLPTDPIFDCSVSGAGQGFSYASNGVDYKVITHSETPDFPFTILDPEENGWNQTYPWPCPQEAPSNHYHIGIWTEGAKCWSM